MNINTMIIIVMTVILFCLFYALSLNPSYHISECKESCRNQSTLTSICGNGICESGEDENNCPRDCFVKSIKIVKENGGRVDWSPKGDLIAFDKREYRYYNVYTMYPDGSNEICLTCGKAELPGKHVGNPAWHPSGEWIVFQVEKENHYGSSGWSMPGIGLNSDLWIMSSDGNNFYQLTFLKTKQHWWDKTPTTGVLHPHFSHDGSKLFWVERLGPGGLWGEWALKVADFKIENGVPKLENVKMFQPREQKLFYESHGFTKDDDKIIFSGNLELNQHETGLDIYMMDLETKKLTRLTDTYDEWDEHAQISPDGNKIVWMSNKGYDFDPNKPEDVVSDYWIMNVDGSNKRQLTYFNKPGYPEYTGERITAADSSWSPDGSKLAALLILNGEDQSGRIIVIEFAEDSVCGNGICESGEDENNCPRDCIYSTTSSTSTSTIPPENIEKIITLHKGWNSIAFPFKDSTPYDITEYCDIYNTVWNWNTSKNDYDVIELSSLSELPEKDPEFYKKGWWVLANSECTVKVTGTQYVDPPYFLKGWNHFSPSYGLKASYIKNSCILGYENNENMKVFWNSIQLNRHGISTT